MSQWSYTIDKNQLTDEGSTMFAVTLLVDGEVYDTFSFPVTDDLTDVNRESLQKILNPLVLDIVKDVTPKQEAVVQATTANNALQGVIDSITQPIELEI